MAQWGSQDDAANSVIWAPAQFKKTPNVANRTALYNNSNSAVYAFDGAVTVGQYGVDETEIAVDGGKVAHTGWVIRTEGSGGRAGRIQTEVLVAGGMSADVANTDDTEYPDA